jgi:hypothetical protein
MTWLIGLPPNFYVFERIVKNYRTPQELRLEQLDAGWRGSAVIGIT